MSEPNDLPCTPGAPSEIGSTSLPLDDARVHELSEALSWALDCLDIADKFVAKHFGAIPAYEENWRAYATARAKAKHVLAGTEEEGDALADVAVNRADELGEAWEGPSDGQD